MISSAQDWERRIGMFPNRTISSGEGSFPSSGELGRNSSMPSLKGRPVFGNKAVGRFPPHFSPPCNPYIFDAARFAYEKKPTPRPRYLDRDRERHVTRWLMEAQDALEKMEPKKKPSSKKKPFLRRFHSHDSNKDFITSAFDDSWNENFILADSSSPKKTKALLKRFQTTNNECMYDEFPTRVDSFERSESARSRRDGESSSPQSTGISTRKLNPREFLERYSLPRVASVEGELHPILLYRHISSYTRVEAVRLMGKKNKPVGKPIYIPDGYQGWFAIVNGTGNTSAKAYSCLGDLVRARVPCFLPAAPLQAYLLQRDQDGERWSYVKGSARGGTPLRLAGVFEEAPRGARARGGTPASPPTSPPQRYAQLVDPNMTELYVPLSTKGEFYPINMETGGADADQDGTNLEGGLQRLSSLLRRALPLRVRLVAGPALPPPLHPTLTTGTLLLRAVTTEAVIVTCTLTDSNKPPVLTLLTLNTDKKLQKANLGFESEKKLLISPKVSKALTYCQLHVDTWIRQITFVMADNCTEKYKVLDRSDNMEELEKEVKPVENKKLTIEVKMEREKKFTFQGFKADASRLFGKSDKILKDIPDENEGSIIFISKNELEHMNYDVYSDDENKRDTKPPEEDKSIQFSNDKMKVFRENNSNHPKFSKWFKHLKILRSTERLSDDKSNEAKKLENYKEFRDPFDPMSDKRNSIERYQDMSKLIEDRYGGMRFGNREELSSEKWQSYRSLTTSSDIGIGSSVSRSEPKRVLTKSVSVQTGILDSPFTDDRMSELGIKKNLSIEQINYYSENDSSLKKKQIYTGNCAKRTENYSGKQKISKFERRQRIRPDLIPEKSDIASSESFDQIQSCEDLNAFGTGSSCSNKNNQIIFNQQSFITEKLCSEFHVKTKRVLSKSTSNLLNGKEKKDTKTIPIENQINNKYSDDKLSENNAESIVDHSNMDDDDKTEPVKLKRSISSIQNRKLPVIEDLPYGQVADAITERSIHERRDSDVSDNIYAEICNPEAGKKDDNCFNISHDIRNMEKLKNEANKTNIETQFRHIEVVVIERRDIRDDNSIDSDFGDSESDEKISESISQKYSSLSESGGFSAGNSLEKDNKNHAIRLEVTHNDIENEPEKNDTDKMKLPSMQALKNGSYVKFSQGITITNTSIAEENAEGIYNTLK